jgi:glutaredoxin
MRSRQLTAVVCLLLGAAAVAPWVGGHAQTPAPPAVELFTRDGCPRCAAAHRLLERLQREQPGLRVVIAQVDRDPQARLRLQALSERAGIVAPGVPSFAIGGALVVGYRDADTERALRALLAGQPAGASAAATCTAEAAGPCEALPDALSVDTRLFGRLSVDHLGLPAFSLALGLLDGFNPCAMWVLLFLLSLLVNLHDRRAMALIAGTFVLVSGAVYFAFLAAWLNVFLLIGVSRAAQVAIGLVAAAVGAINVKDFFAFKRGISLTIPEAAKPGLYDRMRRIVRADRLAASLIGTAVLAVLVNTIELLCTAGLPAIYTSILAAQGLPWWQYYGHLLLYTLAYVADDALMVGLAVATLGRRRLSEHEGRWLKLISGAVMLGLAALLLLWPGALA